MKASELRIGNYVNDSIGLITIGLNGNIKFADAYHPIPLTEEWLLKFGFEKKYQTFEFKGLNIDGTVVHFSFDKWRSEYDIENCDFTEIPAECKHVHQLQNLYFALTNEEL
jgi:hypothetical protein